jgi:hypothetical protein
MTRVRRWPGSIELTLTADEAHLLRMFAELVAGLLAPDDAGAEGAATDPLEALVATSTDPIQAPEDPALLRLLPDAYGDAAAAGEFRRLMESDLRRQKIEALEKVAHALVDVDHGVTFALVEDEPEVWLQALNDIRLFLGSRLGVTEELHDQIEALDPGDPRLAELLAYDWLGLLQESLLQVID